MTKLVRFASFAALATIACTDDPKAAPPAAAVDAGPPAPVIGAPVVWTPCQETFECGSVLVPLDHQNPSGKTLELRLLRAPAKKPAERAGTVVVNPGGPGISMVTDLPKQYLQLRVGFSRAIDRFDIVAFDWRGTGQSSPAKCVDDAFLDRMRATDLTLRGDGSAAAAEALRQEFVAGCTKNADAALLSSMHVENAARDLDVIRQALGEEKLNYLGFSYGTWLGAVYTALFPSRARAFAFDAPVLLPKDLNAQLARRGAGRDEGLDRFFGACEASASCPFHGGKPKAEIAAAFAAVGAKVRTPPGIAGAGRTLSPVDFEGTVADGLRTGNWTTFGATLAALEGGDATTALSAADLALGRSASGTYDGRFEGLLTVSCVDLPFDASTTVNSLRETLVASPSAGSALAPFPLCVSWPFQTPRPPPSLAGAAAAPPALIIAGRHDPITSFADGAAMVSALGNGSHLVIYEGEGHAAAIHSKCVRDLVTDFLLDPKAPAASTCAAE
ncbi:MAG: alpha/beta fold hydrolase [Myxococcales bacterium]|nr:alpha/beta fold hydrolase [Myxococcales bacterium]